MRSLSRGLTAIAACVVAVALASCAPDPGVGTVSPGIPDGVTLDPLSESPAAVWIVPGESFAVVTMGSSSCPAVATAVEGKGDDLISVTFGSSPNNPCTADIGPTTHEFALPATVTGDAVSVEIRFEDWPEVYNIPLG